MLRSKTYVLGSKSLLFRATKPGIGVKESGCWGERAWVSGSKSLGVGARSLTGHGDNAGRAGAGLLCGYGQLWHRLLHTRHWHLTGSASCPSTHHTLSHTMLQPSHNKEPNNVMNHMAHKGGLMP